MSFYQRQFYGTIFYVGDEGVLMIDALEGRADTLKAAVAEVTDLPITAILTVRVVPFAETAHDHAMSMFSDREGDEIGTALVEGQGQSGENKDAPGSCLGASFICGGSGRDHEFGQPMEMPGVGIDGRLCEAQGGATLKKPGQGDTHF